jgi:hypothetical protein
MAHDGTEHKLLAEPKEWGAAGRVSPDGKRALCTVDGKLCVIDLGKPGTPAAVGGVPDGAEVVASAWSPDGKRIAYAIGTSRPPDPAQLKKPEPRLVVADPDGKNAKVLKSGFIFGFDWR